MSGTLNRVQLIGRLGKNPEVKYTPSGVAVAKFSIATDESWKDKSGEKQSRVEWHLIVVWNKLAEICAQYLEKGKLVYIEGRIQSHEWQDSNGVKRRQYEIVANKMLMLGVRGDGGERGGDPEQRCEAAPSPRQEEIVPEIDDESIPF